MAPPQASQAASTRADGSPRFWSIALLGRARCLADELFVPRIPAVKRPYRVVVAKPGLDGHDRGVKIIARSLRDAGFEVIYTGLFQSPDQIAEAARQEDADAVGLSVLSGAHLTLFPRVVEALRTRDLGEVVVFGGGIIPDDDVPLLKEQGVAGVFTPGADLGEISRWLEAELDAREP
jgi:methylmalonyl-CoA mutase, C-terminal domain